MKKTKSAAFLLLLMVFSLIAPQAATCADLTPSYLTPRAGSVVKPVELQRRSLTLEEMIMRSPYPSAFMQPIPLHGVRISGLDSKNVDTLGFNYFLVIDNTKYLRMSDIYRDTRLT